MIISRTPYRISFFGGGTDYPSWYRENGGAVISTSINKFCYVTLRYLPEFFEYKTRLRYFQREEVSHLDEIEHPSIRECLRYVGVKKGVDMIHQGDLPARSGLGTSSTFTVSMLHSAYALIGKMPTKFQLADEARHIEQEIIREHVGSQDQTAAAFGGFNRIDFGGPRGLSVAPIPLSQNNLNNFQKKLMLFFTGFTRDSGTVARQHIGNISKKTEELKTMKSIVESAQGIFTSESPEFDEIGRLLAEQWRLKKLMAEGISNPSIDQIYEIGIKAGAKGGKLLGAGSGGFILFYADEAVQQRVRDELKKLLYVPFRFDFSGSQIVYHSADLP